MTWRRAQPARPTGLRWLPVGALGVYALGVLIWFAAPWTDPGSRSLIATLARLPVTLACAGFAWRAAAAPGLDEATCRVWRLLGIAFLSYSVGDVLWVVYERALGDWPASLYVLGSLFTAVAARQIVSVRENAQLLAERAARADDARFRSLVQHASDVVAVVDLDTTIRYLTPSVERVFGYAPADLLGTRLTALLHAEDVATALTFLTEAAKQPGVTPRVEWRMRHVDGTWRRVETIGTNLLDDPNVRGIVLNSRDDTERRTLEDQLAHQAFHDPLTDLANRALFQNRVGHALARADRALGPLAVLFMDLDNFKSINDSLGHAVGDELLVAVADRLRDCVRSSDTVARLGGDEFAILIEDLIDVLEPARVAERLIDALQAPFNPREWEVYIRASIGIAVSSSGLERADDLLRNADVAMYIAKSRGKGRYEVFETRMHEAVLDRLELEADLRAAVEQHEVVLQYQPIFSLATGRITGVEALARWIHPSRGVLAPLEFIPLAEETGLIVPLGRAVLWRACHQAKVWLARFPSDPPLTMTVNLSPRQLQHPKLVDDVTWALRETGLDPRALILEITESVMLQDAETMVARLHALHDLGVQLAMDDFGTGYSSLSYLQHLPVDILKIDKSFVADIDERRAEKVALVQAILTLAASLRMRTVAEGIERAEQLERLVALGCEQGQGYYFSRPLDETQITALLGCSGHPLTPVAA